MKRTFLALLLAFTGYASFAQSYDAFKLNVFAKKLEDNKKLADKFFADPKTKDKPETLYWEFATYANLFYDTAFTAKYPNADSLAWVALDAYSAKDTGWTVLKANNSFYPSMDYLKQGYIAIGIHSFAKSQWDQALAGFIAVNKVNDYLVAHGVEPKNYLDTTVVLYTGYAAQNAQKGDVAVKYYSILADKGLRVGDTQKFESNMYTYVVDHYLKNGDTQNFNKYLAIAKKTFPEFDNQWGQMEMQNATTNASLPELLAKYKTDGASGKMTEEQYATYGDAFSQPDKKALASLDSATKVQLKLTAADAYSHAARLSNNPVYSYNIGVLYYNIYDEELGSRFYALRGESPALKAARADVEKQQQMYSDSAAAYLTQAYTSLKAKTELEKRDKTILHNTITDLANIYQWKEDKAKGIDPKAVDKYDALYKQYDAEADKN